MANPATPETLALALEERLGTPVAEPFNGLLALTFEGGQRVAARFDRERSSVTLAAPVEAAHDGLPRATLRELLKKNAPSGELAGGMLRVRPAQDFLEIVNLVPAALGAANLANLMINQAEAAAALTRWLADADAAA